MAIKMEIFSIMPIIQLSITTSPSKIYFGWHNLISLNPIQKTSLKKILKKPERLCKVYCSKANHEFRNSIQKCTVLLLILQNPSLVYFYWNPDLIFPSLIYKKWEE